MVVSNTCGSCESARRRGGAPGAIILTDHSLAHSLTDLLTSLNYCWARHWCSVHSLTWVNYYITKPLSYPTNHITQLAKMTRPCKIMRDRWAISYICFASQRLVRNSVPKSWWSVETCSSLFSIVLAAVWEPFRGRLQTSRANRMMRTRFHARASSDRDRDVGRLAELRKCPMMSFSWLWLLHWLV